MLKMPTGLCLMNHRSWPAVGRRQEASLHVRTKRPRAWLHALPLYLTSFSMGPADAKSGTCITSGLNRTYFQKSSECLAEFCILDPKRDISTVNHVRRVWSLVRNIGAKLHHGRWTWTLIFSVIPGRYRLESGAAAAECPVIRRRPHRFRARFWAGRPPQLGRSDHFAI